MQEAVRAALAAITGPDGRDLVAGGRLDGLTEEQGRVRIVLRSARRELPAMQRVAEEAARIVRALPGIVHVSVVLTAERESAARPRRAGDLLPGVRHVVAVASGKGGVGKSTVAVNLAVAFAEAGLATGLVDADIYGPSLPRMLGRSVRPDMQDGAFVPVDAFGLRTMSIGYLVEDAQALVWRGPMVIRALQQLLGDTAWGALDVMVVDLPPGTGDAQLTLTQKVRLDGAVLVSTPQDLALIDARRAASMFGSVDVPVLGIVENMSSFACPECGHVSAPFGHGGARDEAARLGIPFLGEVPLELGVREAGDEGEPVLLRAPESAAARALRGVAARVIETMSGISRRQE